MSLPGGVELIITFLVMVALASWLIWRVTARR